MSRIRCLLANLYSSKSESMFLQYACKLILETTSRSPDYSKELFEHPLSECRWQEYRVDSAWFQRNLLMTPLFGATQMTGGQDNGQDGQTGYIQATQEFAQYTPTQSGYASFAWGPSNPSQTQSTASQVFASYQKNRCNFFINFRCRCCISLENGPPGLSVVQRWDRLTCLQ